jgi:hypothetical protein
VNKDRDRKTSNTILVNQALCLLKSITVYRPVGKFWNWTKDALVLRLNGALMARPIGRFLYRPCRITVEGRVGVYIGTGGISSVSLRELLTRKSKSEHHPSQPAHE